MRTPHTRRGGKRRIGAFVWSRGSLSSPRAPREGSSGRGRGLRTEPLSMCFNTLEKNPKPYENQHKCQ
ncbi:hypothetical protein DV515_00000772, partial [Chloebia gouldiae]